MRKPYWLIEMENKRELDPNYEPVLPFLLIRNDGSVVTENTLHFKNKEIALLWDGRFPPRDGATARVFSYLKGIAKHMKLTLILVWREWATQYLLQMAKDLGIEILLLEPNLYYNEETLGEVLKEFNAVIIRDFEITNEINHPNIIADCQELRWRLLEQQNYPKEEVARVMKEELNAYRKAKIIITISKEEGEILVNRGIDPSKIIHVPQVYDKEWKVNRDKQGEKVMFLGHIVYEPNFRAVKIISEKIAPKLPHRQFVIVGFYPEEALKYKRDNVKFIGEVSHEELLKIAEECGVGIAPLTQAVGQVAKIMTYLSMGIPVVATEIAQRGYEHFIGKGVTVAEIEEFPKAIEEILRGRTKVNEEELLKHDIGRVFGIVCKRIKKEVDSVWK